ncbi:MAG: ATP-binding cassette domain-containing protein [Thermomicrobiales bacterium]
MANTTPIIEASHLSKQFWVADRKEGRFAGLRSVTSRAGRWRGGVTDISFSIQPGEVVGYIGPNGAGKSTTIKMLTGILVPTSGQATVAGIIPWEHRKDLARRIGVVFGQRTQLWWDLPLADSLELLQHMYRVPADRFAANLAKARELLDLNPFMQTPVRQLSLGQRMRGDLAAALLHNPPILYLDEPTIGLDLVAKTRIREFLADLNRQEGVTILLTTHDLADIEHLCSRIIVIDDGRILYDGPLATLKERFGTERQLIVDYEDEPADTILPDAAPSIRVVSQEGPRVRFAFDRHALSATQVLARADNLGTVRDMSIEEPAIEDVIRQLYEGK